MILVMQVAGEAQCSGGDAADQADILVFAGLVGQLKALVPVFDRFASAKGIDFFLGLAQSGWA